jgi:hypothetical protein
MYVKRKNWNLFFAPIRYTFFISNVSPPRTGGNKITMFSIF